MVDGKCKEVGLNFFFPDYNDQWQDIELAKRTCAECPVRAQCLDYAILLRDDEGMWGGIEGERRRRLRYKLNKTFDDYIDSFADDIEVVARYV
jgi:WhiB family transcriptional regulator, redox-sensing transcriptional regulator